MTVKDLLKHLETGNRTMEMLTEEDNEEVDMRAGSVANIRWATQSNMNPGQTYTVTAGNAGTMYGSTVVYSQLYGNNTLGGNR